jgi:GWxTD domain-containing protein
LLSSAAIPAAFAAVLACGAAVAPRLTDGYADWPHGPARWLLLPEEAHVYSRLRSDDDAAAFIVAFWKRRDPDPETPQNAFADRFAERVSMADTLYSDGRHRGALSERGGAFILLGPPLYLRAAMRHKAVPASPGALARPTVPVVIETWGYSPAELPPGVSEMLGRQGARRIELQFMIESDRSYLQEGKEVLSAAARAALLASE